MKRVQVFQFTSQPWFPERLSRLVDEFLRWFVKKVGAARPFVPFLDEALQHAQAPVLFDLQTGAGSGASVVRDALPAEIEIRQIDLEDFRADRPGVYAIINGFHRLSAPQAQAVLAAIVRERRVIAIVEGNNNGWWQAVGMLVFSPLTAILSAPFVRPFRLSRLLFTYLIPLLPLLIAFDGAAALFKLYGPRDLDELMERAGASGYVWNSGKADNGRGGKIIYGIGYPEEAGSAKQQS
jgi:hypothetical protein